MYLSEARGKEKHKLGKSWSCLGEKRGLDTSEVCLDKQADAQGRVDWQGGCSLVARKCRRAVHAPGHRQSTLSRCWPGGQVEGAEPELPESQSPAQCVSTAQHAQGHVEQGLVLLWQGGGWGTARGKQSASLPLRHSPYPHEP